MTTQRTRPPKTNGGVRHGVARALSRAGLCSRSEAARWVMAGRVRVDGQRVLDPEYPTTARSVIEVDGESQAAQQRVYVMLNKPRGLVTTTDDEQGRDTIYRCLEGSGLPWLAPVGRLDKASEGLLLLSNDPAWAARITDPDSGPCKRYHVQIDCLPDAERLLRMVQGVTLAGEHLRARSAILLRSGTRNAWLEIVLEEGRNRQIRRLLAAFDIGVLRLIRVAIGDLVLGEVPKGGWRRLDDADLRRLAAPE